MSDHRILIVGSTPGARTCEQLIKRAYKAKRRPVEELTEDDFAWCSLILTIESEMRRAIAEHHPHGYLSRRVVSLNVPEGRAEGPSALKSMINQQLANHGLVR